MFDVGRSRPERNEWADCVKDINSVVFVVSLTGYCQSLPQDAEIVSHIRSASFCGVRAHAYSSRTKWTSLHLFEKITKLEELISVPIMVSIN